MKDVPKISVGELLKLERRPVKVVPDGQYAEIGIYCFGRGIFHKLPRSGFEVGNKDLFLIKEGDFILQVTFAWEGAVGLTSSAEDGMYGSTRFPTFRVDESRCFPSYLVNYFKTHEGREQLVKISPGSAGRNRVLSLKRIPEVFVPLPPLSEQCRIVARIEGLTAKIEEACMLRKQEVEEAEALLRSILYRQFNTVCEKLTHEQPISTFSTILRGRGPIYMEGSGKLTINQKCVRWNGIDISHAKEVSGSWVQSLPSQYLLQENDLVVNSTGEGTIGRACLVAPDAVGLPFDSHVLVVRVEKTIALPIFISYFLRSPFGQAAIEDSKGAKTTKQTELGTTKLGNISISIPPLSEQRRIIAYLDSLQAKVDALKRLQAETTTELDALTPSILDKAFKGKLRMDL